MSRQFKLEELKNNLIQGISDSGKTKDEMIEIGLKIADEAYKKILENEILTYHILGTKDYPMNNYKVESKKVDMGGSYERTLFEYRSTFDNKLVATIFEQNFFAGYGMDNNNGKIVGIAE